MDKASLQSPAMQPQSNGSAEQRNQSSYSSESQPKQELENKVPRKPGRPPLRIKNKIKGFQKNNDHDNQNDEDFEAEKPKLKERNQSYKEERQNGIEGFLKIIDYLKRIDCDEASLHNKMNPYNLMTPSCFWYMISAEYFSFDFFSNKNPHEVALQFLRKAQKTQISLPLRVLKPQKIEGQLEFETEELKQFAIPITEKLTNLISISSHVVPETLQRSSNLTSITEDNYFRSSTRAILFNWVKKKITSSEKWGSAIKPKLQSASKITPKDFTSRVIECKQQIKHEQLDVAPQIYYRQRKIQKNNVGAKKPIKTQIKKSIAKPKGKSKKKAQDEIYDESQSVEIKKQIQIEQPEQMQDENKQEQQIKQQMQNIQQKEQIDRIPIQESLMKNQQPQNQIQNQQQDLSQQDQINEDQKQNPNGKNHHQHVTINKIYDQDDLLLQSIMHLPIDSVISILKSSIQPIHLPEITRPYMPIPKNDPLQLVYQIHPEQQIFLEYMKERQQKMYQQKSNHTQSMLEQKQREGQVQDAKCQVCTDGDYTDDNLIVFCSMCNISLHQRCVGLAKVPADNWICEVCASFGPSGINVPCPLCHVKGGALKRTSIHINTPLFKDTNPQYHEFAKKCPNYKHKQQYVHQKNPDKKTEQQSYYDYFSKATYPTDQPVCHFVWVHYVCAIWIPQCYFQQKNGLINIKGIENIDKKRFRQRCLICKQVRAGACVKCDNQNCTKFYHPECARKKRIYMEQLNLDKLKYLIFCEAHEPLKVKRKIQVKKKKQRDQIVKFCRGIQKYVQTYKIANLQFKLLKIGFNAVVDNSKYDKKEKLPIGQQTKIMVKIEKNTDQDFIRSVIDGLIKQNQIVVNLSLIGNNRYKVDQVIKPSKRDMRKSLTRQDQFWKYYKSTETPQTNLKRFNTIMRENNYLKQKLQNFINFGNNADFKSGKDDKKGSRRNSGRRRKEKVQTVIQEQGAIFCVCRKPYQGQNDMFQCQVCNEWYHYDCVGFIGTQEDAQNLDFHCMKCLKYESAEHKKQLLDKCSKFFSQDSLFLNLRPPTPSLQSEEQQSVQQHEVPITNKRPQFLEFRVQIEKFPGKSHPNKQYIQQKYQEKCQQKNYDFEERINLQKPFIIFDHSTQQVVHLEEQKNIQHPQKQRHQERQNQQKQIQNEMVDQKEQEDKKQNIEKLNGQNLALQQNSQAKGQHDQKYEQFSFKQSSQAIESNSNINRVYSSQSSQLMTPQFRLSSSLPLLAQQQQQQQQKQINFNLEYPVVPSPSIIVQEQLNNSQKPKKLEQNQGYKIQQKMNQQPNKQQSQVHNQVQNQEQNQEQNQQPTLQTQNNRTNINFHFNRLEVEKLKHTIQQQQKVQKQNQKQQNQKQKQKQQ